MGFPDNYTNISKTKKIDISNRELQANYWNNCFKTYHYHKDDKRMSRNFAVLDSVAID